MFYKVDIRTRSGTLLTLSLEDLSSGFLIKDIAGIDPVDAEIVTSSFAQLDGVQYQASSRGARNIVFKLGYEPDFVNTTVASLRAKLYTFLMPKSFVRMRFYDDLGRTVDTSGYVESFDSPLFAQDPEATISIMCTDPDFIDINGSQFTGTSTSGSTWASLNYEGTVEIGFILSVMVNRTINKFSLKRQLTDGTINTLDLVAPNNLLSGDIVVISTVPGSKYARLKRGSTDSSLLYAVSPQSTWPYLVPGLNLMRVEVSGGIPYTIDYVKRYGGL